MMLRDVRTIEAMHAHGGAFVKRLAEAALAADSENFEKIKTTWPEVWEAYANWPYPQEPHL